jgi:hypothetical protein
MSVWPHKVTEGHLATSLACLTWREVGQRDKWHCWRALDTNK